MDAHSQSKKITERTDVLQVNGHNNKVVLSNKVKKVVIYGHNNRIYGDITDNGHALGVADSLTVTGHNNRLEHLKLGIFQIKGHNNFIQSIRFMQVSDTGINNKFSECYQI